LHNKQNLSLAAVEMKTGIINFHIFKSQTFWT